MIFYSHKVILLSRFLCFFSICSIASAVLAEDLPEERESAEIVNELFLSDIATGQEAGEWQITIAPQYEHNDVDTTGLVALEVEFGITDQFQIEFEYTPYIRVDANNTGSVKGNGNFEFGLQYSWTDISEYDMSIAIAWSHEFAEGDAAVISDPGEQPEEEDNLYIVFAKALNEDGNTWSFLQIGSEIEDNENEAYVNVGMYTRLRDYVFSGELNWADEQTFITPGFTWVREDGLEFGVGLAIGIDGEDDYRIISNIVYEWE